MKKVKQSLTKKTKKNKYNILKYKPEVNGNLTHLVFQLKPLIFLLKLSEKINIPAPERVFIHANSFHSQI